MKKSPCIRGLKAFLKGCPEKTWDGKEGCPCWKEMSVATQGNPKKREIKKQCIDLWMFDFQWASLGLYEANVQSTEQIRNGLLMKDTNGELIPKPDMLTMNILRAAYRPDKAAISHAAEKISKINLSKINLIEEEEKNNA